MANKLIVHNIVYYFQIHEILKRYFSPLNFVSMQQTFVFKK